MTSKEQIGVTIFRVACAATMVIHAGERIGLGGGAPFAEIGSGIALAAGYLVGPLPLGFAVQCSRELFSYIAAKVGLLLVRGGGNGVEFSVLRIACFIARSLLHMRPVDRKRNCDLARPARPELRRN